MISHLILMTSILNYVRIYVWETGCWSLQKGLTIHEIRKIFRERALTSMDFFKIGWVFLKLWAKPVIRYFIILNHWFSSNMKMLCLRLDACPLCYVFAKPTWLPKSMKLSCFVGQCSTKSNQARVVQKVDKAIHRINHQRFIRWITLSSLWTTGPTGIRPLVLGFVLLNLKNSYLRY